MIKSTNALFVLLIALLLLGCESEEKNILLEKNVTSMKQKEDVTKTVKTEEKTVFQEMGLDFENDKIIIDINKTTNFFMGLENKIDSKAKEIEEKIEKADINISRDTGVIVNENEVKIDLNQTKNLLDNLSNLFENILFDINSSNH